MKNLNLLIIFAFLLISFASNAQIKNIFIDSTRHESSSNIFFFTNRPLTLKKDSTVNFKNKSTKSTGKLYFAVYNPEADSLILKFKAQKTGDDIAKIEGTNILSKAFDDLYHKQGVRHFQILVPGYGKTFKAQLTKFMFNIKKNYSDSLNGKIAFVTFAWGDEVSPIKYYHGKKTCKKGAKDFAIFQNLLEDFLKDYPLNENKPRDFSVGISFFSMGNQMFKQYLLQREEQGQELIKTYESISLVGCDVGWNSFKPGKGFHNIDKMTNQVNLFTNKDDKLLLVSSYLNMKKRLGRYGPRKKYPGPDIVHTYDINKLHKLKDISGHNYIFKNPEVANEILEQYKESTKKTNR